MISGAVGQSGGSWQIRDMFPGTSMEKLSPLEPERGREGPEEARVEQEIEGDPRSSRDRELDKVVWTSGGGAIPRRLWTTSLNEGTRTTGPAGDSTKVLGAAWSTMYDISSGV